MTACITSHVTASSVLTENISSLPQKYECLKCCKFCFYLDKVPKFKMKIADTGFNPNWV